MNGIELSSSRVISNVRMIPSRSKDYDPNSPVDYTLKWLTIGDAAVGKTSSLEVAFGNGEFALNHAPTIGIEFYTTKAKVTYSDKSTVDYKALIWDCAGQHRFRSIVQSYYRHANVITILFDVTRRDTFEGVRTWHSHVVQELGRTGYICMLIGTHCDCDHDRNTTLVEGVTLAEELGCKGYYEISAKDKNVMNAFESCLLEAHQAVMDGSLKLIPPVKSKKSFRLLHNTKEEKEDEHALSGCVTCPIM